MLFVGLIVSLVPVPGFLIGEVIPLWVRLVFSPLLVVGVYMMGTGLYMIFGSQLALFNLATGQAWQQGEIFGLPVSQTKTSAVEIIPWMGAPARVLRYPASVAELCRERNAAEFFATALLQLTAQGVVNIGQVTIHRRWRKPSRVYVLVPGEGYGEAVVQGKFEKRLIEVVGQARVGAAYFELDGTPYTRSFRSVLCLEDAIRMVFGIDQKDGAPLQVYRIVEEEAVELGLGAFGEKRLAAFKPGKNSQGKISLDLRSIDLLHHDFWTTYPEHARDLLAQIDLITLPMVPARQVDLIRSRGRL